MKTAKNLASRTNRSRARLVRWDRPLLFILAWMCLALGIVGLFLPLLPGTLFLIFAAACFTRSSPRFEAWLLDHPRFGPPVRAWRASGSIPRRAKIFACASLALSWWVLYATAAPFYVQTVCLVIFIGVGAYVATRPEG